MKTTKLSVLGALTEEEGSKIITEVYKALEEKGYDPIRQIVGYLISEDPTYVTGYNNARSLITKVPRDEIIEVLLLSYIANKV